MFYILNSNDDDVTTVKLADVTVCVLPSY